MARQHPSNHAGRTCRACPCGTRAHPYRAASQSHGGVAASGGQLLDMIPGRSHPGDDNADTSGDRTPFLPHAKQLLYHYTTRSVAHVYMAVSDL